jgi:triosephosphate isomerase (TIM)
MRTPLIAGNWKLFKTLSEATKLIEDLKPLISKVNDVEVVVAPVFTAIAVTARVAKGSTIMVAAQDCYWEEEGAFTGEVSPKLLMDAGCTHVIIGHSERRQYFGETDQTVNRKTKAALTVGLTVLLCVGESLVERESNSTFDVIETQVRGGFDGIPASLLSKLVIAYEPVWAIGTGKTASDEQAQEVHAFIRNLMIQMYSKSDADNMRILYGGSVKPDNIKGLMEQADIDGALVGGASLKADLFAGIVCFRD